MKIGILLLLLFLGLIWVSYSEAQEGVHIEAGEVVYDEINNLVEAKGGVRLTWQDLAVSTYRLLYFLSDNTLLVPELLEVSLGENRARAQRFFFDFQHNTGWIEDADLLYVVDAQRKLYFRGRRINYQQGKWWGKDLLLTGSQKDPPAYSFKAEEVTIYPGEKIDMQGVSFYLGKHRLLYLPSFTRDLLGSDSSFFPQLGYERGRGFFVGGSYELSFADEWRTLFEVEYTSCKGFLGSGSLFFEHAPLVGGLFYDWRGRGKDSFGGYFFYTKEDFQGGILSYFNQPLLDEKETFLTRPFQAVVRFSDSKDRKVSWGLDASYGFFEEGAIADERLDLRGTLAWQKENFEASLLFHYTDFGFYPDRLLWGGKISLEEGLGSGFSGELAYTFLSDNVVSPFSFDKDRENSLSLGFALGNREGSFLRVRGKYDFTQNCFAEVIFGLSLGDKDFGLGFEEWYSFVENKTLERRYFVRKRVSDALLFEASYFDEQQTFYLDVTLIGFDPPAQNRSLFEEKESFDLFELGRDGSN